MSFASFLMSCWLLADDEKLLVDALDELDDVEMSPSFHFNFLPASPRNLNGLLLEYLPSLSLPEPTPKMTLTDLVAMFWTFFV